MKHEEVEREIDNLSHKKGRRQGIGISKRKLIGVFIVLGIFLIASVSAAYLTHFGTVTVTADVKQSIVISEDGGQTWLNYNNGVETYIPEMVHCTDYTYKYWIWNRACVDVVVEIEDTWIEYPGNPDGYEKYNYIFGDTQTIRLLQKVVDWGDSPWLELPQGAYADLTFSTCDARFDYTIDYSGLVGGTSYSLIYYANLPDYWEEGPVTVLGTFTPASTDGTYSNWKSDAQTMPFVDDENANRPISILGESYVHDYGAKFWIVPTDALNGGSDVDWGMASDFLFETDLGLYINCDGPVIWLPNVYPIFQTHTLKSGQTYCWINNNHIVIDIMGGIYSYESKLVLQP